MTTADYTDLIDLFRAQGSRIFSVEFIKKDGSYRKMLVQNCVLPTRVKGENASEQAKRAVAARRANHPELYNIWDMDRNAPRSINLDSLLRVHGGGALLYEAPDAEKRIAESLGTEAARSA